MLYNNSAKKTATSNSLAWHSTHDECWRVTTALALSCSRLLWLVVFRPDRWMSHPLTCQLELFILIRDFRVNFNYSLSPISILGQTLRFCHGFKFSFIYIVSSRWFYKISHLQYVYTVYSTVYSPQLSNSVTLWTVMQLSVNSSEMFTVC